MGRRGIDENRLGKAAKQPKDAEVLGNEDQYIYLAPDAGRQRGGMNLAGGDLGGAFGGRVGLL